VVAVDPHEPSAGTVKATSAWLRQARLDLTKLVPESDAVRSTIRVLERLEIWLQRPPRIAVMGEANTGKTSLINLFLGGEHLPSGVLANTRLPTLVIYGLMPELLGRFRDGSVGELRSDGALPSGDLTSLELRLPNPRLQELEFVDCVTVGAPMRIRPETFLGADGLVWCTAMTQAWRNTERKLWQSLPKKLQENSLLAVTFADLIEQPDERAAAIKRVQSEIGSSMRAVVPVGARNIFEALQRTGSEIASLDAVLVPLMNHRNEIALRRATRARSLAARFAERTLRNLDRSA
jgi:GTPase SAR1 family protein